MRERPREKVKQLGSEPSLIQMHVLVVGDDFDHPILKLLLIFRPFPKVCVLAKKTYMLAYCVNKVFHFRNKIFITASTFCDLPRNTVLPGRAISCWSPKRSDVNSWVS